MTDSETGDGDPVDEIGDLDAGTVDDGTAFDSDAIDAIVYDLDGTLVRLAVDWGAAATDVERVLREHGVDPPAGLWDSLEYAEEHGHREAVEAAIAEHEREGALRSERLALADTLAGRDEGDEDGNKDESGASSDESTSGERSERRPVGVCSLNCEAACRLALETHGLAGRVEAVVGRDSVGTYKPDPEPLLTVIEHLGATPERTLFVGDSERDERTARRAGTAFVYVSDVLSEAD